MINTNNAKKSTRNFQEKKKSVRNSWSKYKANSQKHPVWEAHQSRPADGQGEPSFPSTGPAPDGAHSRINAFCCFSCLIVQSLKDSMEFAGQHRPKQKCSWGKMERSTWTVGGEERFLKGSLNTSQKVGRQMTGGKSSVSGSLFKL